MIAGCNDHHLGATMTTTTTPATLQTGVWEIDPAHTTVEFVARHLMMSRVRGNFEDIAGTATVADDLTRSSLDVTVQLASVNTRTPDRDNHLRSPDFFDVTNHPAMKFRSTKIVPSGGDWRVTGDLTIRGVTKPIELTAEFLGVAVDPWGNDKAVFSARGELTRDDWGLNWNVPLETGGVLVSRKVQIEIEAQLIHRS
jgi:polyisoprenoid-binding protein YceI